MDFKFDLQLFATVALDFKTGIKANEDIAAGATGYIGSNGEVYASKTALDTASAAAVAAGNDAITQIGTLVAAANITQGDNAVKNTNISSLKLEEATNVSLTDANQNIVTDSLTMKLNDAQVPELVVTSFNNMTLTNPADKYVVFEKASGDVKITVGDKGTLTLSGATTKISNATGDVAELSVGSVEASAKWSGKFLTTTEALAVGGYTFSVKGSGDDAVYTVEAKGTDQAVDLTGITAKNLNVSGTAGANAITVDTTKNVTVDGGDGKDTITLGGAGAVASVDGGKGDDKVVLGAALGANSKIEMGAGADTINVEVSQTVAVSYDFGDGDDVLQLTADTSVGDGSTLLGGAGKDTIDFTGGAAVKNLLIDGGDDADKIVLTDTVTDSSVVAGAGDDTIASASATDTLTGGDGKDVFDISGANAAANIADYKFGEDVLFVTGTDVVKKANDMATGTTGGLESTDSVGTLTDATGSATVTGSGYFAVTLKDKNGSVGLGWVGASGTEINAGDMTTPVVLSGRTNSEGDTLVGGSKADTIYAGAKDSVYGGAGSDTIDINTAAGKEAYGVYVGLSTAGGSDEVKGFYAGWNIEKADAVYMMDGTADDLKLTNDGKDVSLKSGSASMKLTSAGAASEAQVLINDKKVDIIAKGKFATVDDNSTIGDYYVGTEASGIDMTAYTSDVQVDLGTEMFRNITTVKAGKGDTSILGGKAAESLIGGAGATSLYGGAGIDTLVSGDGKTTFFANESSGKDVVTKFTVGTDDSSDVINVNNLKSITRSGSKNFKIDLDGTNTLSVEQRTGDNNSNVQWASGDANGVAKIGYTSDKNKFTYDAATTNYIGGNKEDIVSLASGTEDNFEVWVDNTGNMFNSIEVYDFSQTTGDVLAAGKANTAETIVGGKGSASLWGGAGKTADVLQSTKGSTTQFFYGLDDGNDVIKGQAGDTVNLYNISLDQIKSANIGSNNVVFTTSSNDTVTVSGSVGTFKLADGTSWTADYSKKTWTQN